MLNKPLDNLLGGPGRVPGLDVARGIAVLGMFTAHVGVTSDDTSTLAGWLSLAHGRSSILFATVAGVSLAIVTGRREPLLGRALAEARARLLVRAVLLLALVAVLDLLGTRVFLILGFYAAYFALALPFLRWPAARLAGLAAAVAVVGPVLVLYGPELLARGGFRLPHDGSGAVTDFLLTGHYPALVWMAYVFAGLAVGRSDLRSPVLRLSLVAGGFGLAVARSALSAALVPDPAALEYSLSLSSSQEAGTQLAWDDPWPPSAALWLASAHSDSVLEAFGSGGFALGVLGLCLSVGRIGARVLAPLAAVGALALTVYSAQIVAIWWWSRTYWDLLDPATNVPLGIITLVTLAAATAWRAFLGRGPLERLFAWVAKATVPGAVRATRFPERS